MQAEMKMDDTVAKCHDQIEFWKNKQIQCRKEQLKVEKQLKMAATQATTLDAKIFVASQKSQLYDSMGNESEIQVL